MALQAGLSVEDVARIEAAVSATDIVGTRYPQAQMVRLGH